MGRRIRDYDQTWLERQTPLGLTLKVIAFVVIIVLVMIPIGCAVGWFNTGAQVISPQNVKAQWQFAYDYEASLGASASNWCTALADEQLARSEDVRVQLSLQRRAIEQNYNRIKAEYDGRLRDAFRAKLVKPPDVPNRAPTLEEKVAQLGCRPTPIPTG